MPKSLVVKDARGHESVQGVDKYVAKHLYQHWHDFDQLGKENARSAIDAVGRLVSRLAEAGVISAETVAFVAGTEDKVAFAEEYIVDGRKCEISPDGVITVPVEAITKTETGQKQVRAMSDFAKKHTVKLPNSAPGKEG